VERSGRIGIVPPRYGDEVIGGAEAVLRELAQGLAGRGWDVEVLTTCARDHFSWANEYAPGLEERDGLKVRRFPTVLDTRRAERAEISATLLAGGEVDLHRQQRWMNDDLRVPDLWHHLLDHGAEYRALIFAPYLFWTTFAGGQVAPERTILVPCLHDEPDAWLELFRPLFSGARGLWFLSEPEHQLAHRIHGELPDHEVTGAGVPVPERYDPDGFRERHGIHRPFVLYAGRREGGKNWEWLLSAFARAVKVHDLPFALVTMGTGAVSPPAEIADRVIDLGFLPHHERDDAFAAADAYVQPSALESFSRTVMEAWLAGTPVLANGASEVVAWHCKRSGAGLTFADEVDLGWALQYIADRPDAARALAKEGREYVLEHYRWDDVLDRLEPLLEGWTQ
jgi:glycosyltransferase involved in cell wall biosynthesis